MVVRRHDLLAMVAAACAGPLLILLVVGACVVAAPAAPARRNDQVQERVVQLHFDFSSKGCDPLPRDHLTVCGDQWEGALIRWDTDPPRIDRWIVTSGSPPTPPASGARGGRP